MKPIIGILGSVNDERKTNLVYAYVRAVSQAWAIPVILPNCDIEETVDDFCRLCDGFLFTGGGDVAPAYYGAEKLPTCGPIQPLRDQFDFQVFQKVFPTKKPILGICRGIQVINVALGGTLYQDLPSERPAGLAHQQAEEHNAHSHYVRIERNTPLYDLMGVERLRANSFHHQAIKALGRGLTVTALAEDGVIEAVTYEGDRYLRGYQWHPERLCGRDDYSHRIFQDFIGACERARKGEG